MSGTSIGSQAVSASGLSGTPMCGLMQRRLLTPEVHHNEEDGAHSLPRGDSVLTTAHIPIHNLLHSPTMFALRCRDQRLEKSDFDFRPSLLAGIPFHVVPDQGTELSGALGAAVAAQRGWWKGGPFSYVTKATSGSAVRCCVVPGRHQGGAI